jgi:thiamine biosynthesis protein ThiI
MTSIVVHYQEIALKGKNRPWFIARLVNNIRRATSDLDVRAVRPLVGRLELVLGPAATYGQVAERLTRVFGIANFSKASRAPLDIEAIAAAILRDLGETNPRSFRVTVKRADKRFPMKSPEIEREVGGRIKLAKGWRVDLDSP